ncbi:MAG: hypothetical protein QXU32_01080 [Nitrososphaerales archaeon]
MVSKNNLPFDPDATMGELPDIIRLPYLLKKPVRAYTIHGIIVDVHEKGCIGISFDYDGDEREEIGEILDIRGAPCGYNYAQQLYYERKSTGVFQHDDTAAPVSEKMNSATIIIRDSKAHSMQ